MAICSAAYGVRSLLCLFMQVSTSECNLTAGFATRRDTFLCSAKEKYPKERRSLRLARCAGFLRFSPFRALAELAGFAAPIG
jgi:hypothetical protein